MSIGEWVAICSFAFTVLGACLTMLIKQFVTDERHRLLIQAVHERQASHEKICEEDKKNLREDLKRIYDKLDGHR